MLITPAVQTCGVSNLKAWSCGILWDWKPCEDNRTGFPAPLFVLQVQRHLQLRIEAQGKYLQSILEKAKETLANHTGATPGLEAAHVELTELASKVITDPLGPSFPSLGLPNLSSAHEDNSQGVSLQHQFSRVSDTSSQKSYLTNLTVKPEDSGGGSGSSEHQASTGKHQSSKAWCALF